MNTEAKVEFLIDKETFIAHYHQNWILRAIINTEIASKYYLRNFLKKNPWGDFLSESLFFQKTFSDSNLDD